MISTIQDLDFVLMEQFVRYAWFDLGGSENFKIALTKKERVWYGIEEFA